MSQARTAYIVKAIESTRRGLSALEASFGDALSQTCVLPWPPSVNKLAQVDRRGRKAYREEAILAIQTQRLRAYERSERVAVRIWCYAPDHRVRDLDNVAKAPLDALQKGGILYNDHQVDDLRIVRRTPDPAMPRIEIALALLVGRGEALDLVDELERDAVAWIEHSDHDRELLEEQRARVRSAANRLRVKLEGAP